MFTKVYVQVCCWIIFLFSLNGTVFEYAFASNINAEKIPEFTSPEAGSSLTNEIGTETFTWSPSTANVAEYWVYIYNGDNRIFYDSGRLSPQQLNITVTNLPIDGSNIYARLWYRVAENKKWNNVTKTYTNFHDVLKPVLSGPVPLSTLSSIETFTWSGNGTNASNYWLYVGVNKGDNSIFNSGHLGNDKSVKVSDLTNNGATTLYARLWYLINEAGPWFYIDEEYSVRLGELNLDNIVVDKFGYKPEMNKVANFRDGEIGLGVDDSDYSPGQKIAVVDDTTNEIVFTGSPNIHKGGIIDPQSGDRTWTFDFSTVQTPGTYYVFDALNNARSATFEINDNVYDNVLREAFKTFIYQRSSFAKTADIVGDNYADDASHIGPFQDSGARLFNDLRNRSTARDLSGGWYDAGDFKKYSNWTADYILGLLHAYHDNPEAWADNWNLPDSGNGVPDILDEVRWGVTHLQRMQETSSETTAGQTGSVLSVVDSDDRVTPPSENEANSFYGSASTSATFTSAAAFAYASSTFAALPDTGFQNLAESLRHSAISAYKWAENNLNIRFNNPENGVGNGNSEVSSDYMLDAKHRIAAIYLYGLTSENSYKSYVENNYKSTNLMTVFLATPYEVEEPTALLHYTTLNGINPSVGSNIQSRFNALMENAGNGRSSLAEDPYRAYVQEYIWGSNKPKSRKGHMYTQLVSYDLGNKSDQDNLNAAAGYLHYIHGVNPLGKVYLTNMGALGAERSVDELYHRWFANDSQWDNVNSSFGPPPGYLVGGPNQFYDGSQYQSTPNEIICRNQCLLRW